MELASKRKVRLLKDRAYCLDVMRRTLGLLYAEHDSEKRNFMKSKLKRLGEISQEIDLEIKTA